MSVSQFLRILLARRWTIIIATLACFVVATGVAMSLPKRYTGTARVMLDTAKPDPVTGTVIGTSVMRSYTATQLQLITDIKVTGAVVDRLNLVNDPTFLQAYVNSGAGELEGGMRRWIAGQIGANTSANLVEGSNILEINYQGPAPQLARDVAGLLRETYIEESLRMRTDSASRTGGWFAEQAAKAQRELQTAERARAEFMRANNLVVQNGVELEQQKLTNLQASLVQMQGSIGTQDAAATARLANDPVVDQLRVQLAQLEDQVTSAAERLGPQHPTYQALIQRRNTLRSQLAQAQGQSRSGIAASLGASRQGIAQLSAQVEAQRAKVLGMKGVLDQLDQLTREVDLRRDQYEKAAARAAQLRVEADVAETGLINLGDPIASSTPTWPKVPLISGLSLVFGLGLGVLIGLLTELVARRVRGPEDLAYATAAPVLAIVDDRQRSRLRVKLARLLSRRGKEEPSYDADGDWQAAE